MPTRWFALCALAAAAITPANAVKIELAEPAFVLADSAGVRSRIVAPPKVTALERLGIERLNETLMRIHGFRLPVTTDGGNAIVLGTPGSHPLLQPLAAEVAALEGDGFVARPLRGPRGDYFAVAAKTPAGVFQGALYLAEFALQSRAGIVYLQASPVTRQSPIRLRGTYNLVCWGLAPRYTRQDWEKVIDAMAEDGMNLIYFWLSGIFRSKLFPESVIYPESPLTTEDIRQLIRHAHGRGVDFYVGTGVFAWFGIDEIAKYRADLRDVGIPYMSRTRPAARAAMKQYLHELFDAFPEAKGMWLEIGDEGDYACKDPACQQPLDEFGSKRAGQVTPTFLKEFSAELWAKHPRAKLVWGMGYPEAHAWDVKYYDTLRRQFSDPRYHFLEVRQNWELQDHEGVLKPIKGISANTMHWDQYYRLSLREIGEKARRVYEDELAGYIVAFEPGFNSHSVFGRAIPFPVDAIPYRLTRFAYKQYTWEPNLSWPEFKKRVLTHFFGEGADPELFDLTYTLQEFMRTGPIHGSFRELTKPVDGRGHGRLLKPRLEAIERRLNAKEASMTPRAKAEGLPLLRRAIADLRTGYSIQ